MKEEQQEEDKNINELLPHEIISIILNEINDKSMIHSRRVCKLWHSCLIDRWQNRKPSHKPVLRKVFGKKGRDLGQFYNPSDVTVDS
jgi:hypothetical protein